MRTNNVYLLFVSLLVGLAICVTGCDSGSSDNDNDAPAAAEAEGGDNGEEAQPPAADDDGEEREVPPAEDPFTRITPGRLSADVFTVAGRGTVVTLRCGAIDGAVSYSFTTSMGQSESVAVPEVGVRVGSAPPADATFEVYATNAEGSNTRTASANIRR